MRMCIIGCGRLGAPYGAGMAEMGHQVLGVDTNPDVIRLLRSGRAPFDEPGLHEAIACHARTGNLRFTSSYDEAAEFSDLHILCVGTPQQATSLATDLHDLTRAVRELSGRLRRNAVFVIKSSVPAGTTARFAAIANSVAPHGSEVSVVCSPDFLRESTSLEDIRHPSRIVLGLTAKDMHAEELLRKAWALQLESGVDLLVTDVTTAELSKMAANAFLAAKISFINAMAAMCEASGADVTLLSRSLALDPRIGPYGLDAGAGFGGSCLPKDLRGLLAQAQELGLSEDLRLLADVDAINVRRQRRVVDLTRQVCGGDLSGKRLGVWGMSFKPGIDDIRDSPAVAVALAIQAEGAKVTAYDPVANDTVRAQHPALGVAHDPFRAAAGADALLHLTAWPLFAKITPGQLRRLVSAPVMIDGRATLDPPTWTDAGWTYLALGRAAETTRFTTSAGASVPAARSEIVPRRHRDRC